jgi:LemA protein
MTYNTRREQFPTLIIAGMGGFTEAFLFEIEAPEQREAPKVKF